MEPEGSRQAGDLTPTPGAAALRDEAADARDAKADARDAEADRRDAEVTQQTADLQALLHEALRRDAAAERRDRAAEGRDHEAELMELTDEDDQKLRDMVVLHRQLSSVDRVQAGMDRDLSAGDRADLLKSQAQVASRHEAAAGQQQNGALDRVPAPRGRPTGHPRG